MRTFKEMNKEDGSKCLICGTQDTGEVVLIGLAGAKKDNIIEAKQAHLHCINLTYSPSRDLIYQVVLP